MAQTNGTHVGEGKQINNWRVRRVSQLRLARWLIYNRAQIDSFSSDYPIYCFAYFNPGRAPALPCDRANNRAGIILYWEAMHHARLTICTWAARLDAGGARATLLREAIIHFCSHRSDIASTRDYLHKSRADAKLGARRILSRCTPQESKRKHGFTKVPFAGRCKRFCDFGRTLRLRKEQVQMLNKRLVPNRNKTEQLLKQNAGKKCILIKPEFY